MCFDASSKKYIHGHPIHHARELTFSTKLRRANRIWHNFFYPQGNPLLFGIPVFPFAQSYDYEISCRDMFYYPYLVG